jgi:hypothetical protein
MKRRDLLKGTAVGIPVAVGLPLASAAPALAGDGDIRSAADVLCYALNLKYVQAEFYRQGNAAGLLTGREADYLSQIGYHKQQHVAALTNALNQQGAQAPAAPGTDFGDAFATRESYLDAAYTIDNTVLRAYVGMPSQPVFGQSFYVDVAGIFSLDARSTAAVATLAERPVEGGMLFAGGVVEPLPPSAVLEALQPYITGPWAMAPGAAITG